MQQEVLYEVGFGGNAAGGSSWKWGLLVVQHKFLLNVRFVGSATGDSRWK